MHSFLGKKFSNSNYVKLSGTSRQELVCDLLDFKPETFGQEFWFLSSSRKRSKPVQNLFLISSFPVLKPVLEISARHRDLEAYASHFCTDSSRQVLSNNTLRGSLWVFLLDLRGERNFTVSCMYMTKTVFPLYKCSQKSFLNVAYRMLKCELFLSQVLKKSFCDRLTSLQEQFHEPKASLQTADFQLHA